LRKTLNLGYPTGIVGRSEEIIFNSFFINLNALETGPLPLELIDSHDVTGDKEPWKMETLVISMFNVYGR